jgi:hypothetical protein
MNEQQVVDLMKSSKNVDEWNNNCDKVKAAFGGQYPSFWFSVIILGGVHNETKKNWDE